MWPILVNIFTEYQLKKKDSELKKCKMIKQKWKLYFNLFPYNWGTCSLNAKKIHFKSRENLQALTSKF